MVCTQGYKNNSYDGHPVRQEKVLGKVIAIKRKSSVVGLPLGGLQSLWFRFDCVLAEYVFYLKKILARIPFLKEIYRYIGQKINPSI